MKIRHAKNWQFGNESSILVSDNKQISVSLKLENLFIIGFILRYPIITFLG